METSLRERKRMQLRAQLIAASQRLFVKHGYDATTIERICDEVQVSPQTLLRYFESKQQLALAPHFDALDAFRRRVTTPDREQDAVEVWRRHVSANAFGMPTRDSDGARMVDFVSRSPALLTGVMAIAAEYETLLSHAISRDRGVDPAADLHGRMLATLLVWGNHRAFREWMESDRESDLRTELLSVIDFALEHLGHPGTRPPRRRRQAASR